MYILRLKLAFMSTRFGRLGIGLGSDTSNLRWSQFALVITFAAFVLSACVSNSASDTVLSRQDSAAESPIPSDCQVVSHDWGTTKICDQPQRVIALSPYELDLSLSLDIQPVGYAEDSRALLGSPHLGEAMNVKYLGDRIIHPPAYVGTRQSPSLEAILKLKPDLILCQSLDQLLYEHLSEIAPVVLPNFEENFDQWKEDILILGQVMNRKAQAQQVLKNYHDKIANVSLELQPISQNQKILLLSMTDLDPIEVFTDKTFAGNLLNGLGFQLIVPKQLPLEYGIVTISLESLPQLKPEIIIVMASGNSSVEQVKTLWRENPILQRLPASQSEHVYFVDYQLWGRITGPIAAELMVDEVRQFLLQGAK